MRLRFLFARPRLTGAAAGILLTVATVFILLGSGFTDAQRWALDPSETRWIAGLDDGLPYRPPESVRPRSLQDQDLSPPDRVQIYHDFSIASRDPAAMTLLLPVVGGDAALFMNGVPTEPAVPLSEGYLALSESRSVIWEIPATLLRPGRNRIDLMLTGSGRRGLGAAPILAPAGSSEVLYGRIIRLVDLAREYLLPLSLSAAVLALIAGAALRTAAPWIALSSAALAIGARTVISDPPLQALFGPFGPWLDQIVLSASLVGLGCALIGATPPPTPRMRRWGLGAAILFAVLAVLALAGTTRGIDELAIAGRVLPILALAFPVAIGRSALLAPSSRSVRGRFLEGGVSSLVALAALAAAFGASGLLWGLWLVGLDVAYGLGVFTLLAGLALTAATLSVRELVRWLRDRPRLSRIIVQQQREIEATTLALQRELKWSGVLEERQRLSRDMHDGIGGQLTSLLARVRSRRISARQMESELTNGLLELRLMVDSLDASDGSVADALSVLRARIRTQTEAAQLSLDWSQSEALTLIASDPGWILNLNRLVQEAVTNAVRHAGGDQVRVTIDVVGDRMIAATVEDNGRGFDLDEVQAGRGLANLRFRTARMEGRIEIGRTGSGAGTAVRLVAPIPLPREDLIVPGGQSPDDMIPS